MRLFTVLLLILGLSFAPAFAVDPPILEAGMDPAVREWAFTRGGGEQRNVRFWMRTRREGFLNTYGNFDYYLRVQVLRPDGSIAWDTQYGFDLQGYADTSFVLPGLFFDLSPNKAAPSFGAWRIRTVLFDNAAKVERASREYVLNFSDGSKAAVPGGSGAGSPFSVPPFTHGSWTLRDWGIGLFRQSPSGPGTYDVETRPVAVRASFSLAEIREGYARGEIFGARLAGPPQSAFLNSGGMPLYVFGYALRNPDGSGTGEAAAGRNNKYVNNPGDTVFPLDPRSPGPYRVTLYIRDRDSPSWDEASWKRIGELVFTVTP